MGLMKSTTCKYKPMKSRCVGPRSQEGIMPPDDRRLRVDGLSDHAHATLSGPGIGPVLVSSEGLGHRRSLTARQFGIA